MNTQAYQQKTEKFFIWEEKKFYMIRSRCFTNILQGAFILFLLIYFDKKIAEPSCN